MKKWIVYLLILATLGFGIGYLVGPYFYVPPVCSSPEMACMGDPYSIAWRVRVGIIGTVIGAIIGVILGKIKFKKK